MVSVVSSFLSQTLWRVLGGDPHYSWTGERRAPQSAPHNGQKHHNNHHHQQQQQQRHAIACCTGGHVSEAGEPGGWVVLDPMTSPAGSAPSLVELCAPSCQAKVQQQEAGQTSTTTTQHMQSSTAPTPAEPLNVPTQNQETTSSSDEDYCCVTTSQVNISVPGVTVTQDDQGVTVAGSMTAAGSSAGSVRARWRRRRQFVERRRPEHLSRSPPSHCPRPVSRTTMDHPPGTPARLPRASPSRHRSSPRGPGNLAGAYNEDIRDFDIYKITPTGEEPQYPRLPALPTQSDSDTDEGAAGTQKTLKRRKRRNAEPRVAGRKRLHLEKEENTRAEVDTASPLHVTTHHQDTTTTRPATPPRPAAPPSCPSTVTLGHCRVGGVWEEGAGSDRSDDEDDDETTVVPEDFFNDTDSDIEILIQSGKCVTTNT